PFISLSIHFMKMKILIGRDSDGPTIHKPYLDKTQNVKTNVDVSRVFMHFLMQVDANLDTMTKYTLKHWQKCQCFLICIYNERNKFSASSSCSCFFSGISSR